MKGISRLGIDLAKNIFELCGVDDRGHVILRKTLKRNQLLQFLIQLQPTTVCVEACGGAHYWARKLHEMGHKVEIIPAQHVKPFVKSQKNDRNDALAITEASVRPTMDFVQPKQIWQQDIQAMHRVRSRLLNQMVELTNQTRGLLMEYGITMGLGMTAFKKNVPLIVEDSLNELTDQMRVIFQDLFEEYLLLEKRKSRYDKLLETVEKQNPVCKRLTQVPGIGPLTSTIFAAHIGDAQHFKNGRQAAASLGLVPKQRSTGGRTILNGITKRGDVYLRSLLVHGARAVVAASAIKPKDQLTQYQLKIREMLETKHMNKVVIAVANRNVRVMLTMLKTGEDYKVA